MTQAEIDNLGDKADKEIEEATVVSEAPVQEQPNLTYREQLERQELLSMVFDMSIIVENPMVQIYIPCWWRA